MSDGEDNEIFWFFVLSIKQKRKNKDVLVSTGKVVGKQINL